MNEKKNWWLTADTVFLVVGVLVFWIAMWALTADSEKISGTLKYAGVDDLSYVKATVDVGDRYTHIYYGVIEKEEYEKWTAADEGSIRIGSPQSKDAGWEFKNAAIVSLELVPDVEAKRFTQFYSE